MADFRRSPSERLPVPGGSPEAVARVVNGLLDGRSQNTGRVTLAQSAESTVIFSPIFRASTVIILTPLSEAAAGVVWWQGAVADKRSVTIEHEAPPDDMPFAWVAIG